MHKKILKIIRGHSLNPEPSLLIVTPNANLFINSSIEFLRYIPKVDHTKENIILLTSINQPWTYCNLHSNITNLYSHSFYKIKIYGPKGIIQLYQNFFQNTYMRLAYKVPTLYDGHFKLLGQSPTRIIQMRKEDEKKFNNEWIESQKQSNLIEDNQNQNSFSLSENLNLNIIRESETHNSYSIVQKQKKLIWISETLNQQQYEKFNSQYQQIYTYRTQIPNINKKITVLKQQSKNQLPIHSLDFKSKWELIVLGTASAQPTQHKNTSAYLFRCQPEKFILLQCGPNTHIQLYKAYGKNYWDVINKIECVFISHFHSDHHFGMIKLLEDMVNSFKKNKIQKKVVLLLPKSILKYVNMFLQMIAGQEYFMVVNSIDYRYQKNSTGNISIKIDFLSCKLTLFATQHCFGSFGVILQKYNQKNEKLFKVAYTGDTKDCTNAKRAAVDADLFIHQCTFMQLEQRNKTANHSNLEYVLAVGLWSKCTNLAITHYQYHFLTRLKQLFDRKINFKSINFNNQFTQYFNDKVIICHDFLKITDVNQSQLPKITRQYCSKNNQQ